MSGVSSSPPRIIPRIAPRIVLRADGGAGIGLGHVARCAALGRALERAGAQIRWRTRTPGIVRQAWPGAVEALSAEDDVYPADCDCLILDLKQSNAARINALGRSGKLALIGNHTGEAQADLFLRQGFAPTVEADALGGPEHLLLAESFTGLSPREPRGEPARLLVSLGGSRTPRGERAMQALPALGSGWTLDIAGPYPPSQMLRTGFGEVLHSAHAGDMAERMLKADLALLAGGTTLHEAGACGLPAVCIAVADNQETRTRQFEELGLGLRVESPAQIAGALSALIKNPRQRADIAERGQSLVDGRGAERCAQAIIALANTPAQGAGRIH